MKVTVFPGGGCIDAAEFTLPYCIIRPDAGNEELALRASTILDAKFHDVVPRAVDEKRLTIRAIGVCTGAVDVPFVHVAQADFHRDLTGAIQRGGRSPRFVLQLEIGMKRGEVQRNIRPEMGQNPFSKLAR